MNTVFVLVGLPGVRKTSWAREAVLRWPELTKIVSLDAIREMFYGRYDYRDYDEELVAQVGMITARYALSQGSNVILDDALLTLTASARREVVNYLRNGELIGNRFEIIAVCFPLPSVEHLKGVRASDPKGLDPAYWSHVIDELYQRYEPMVSDEGFDCRRASTDGYAL